MEIHPNVNRLQRGTFSTEKRTQNHKTSVVFSAFRVKNSCIQRKTCKTCFSSGSLNPWSIIFGKQLWGREESVAQSKSWLDSECYCTSNFLQLRWCDWHIPWQYVMTHFDSFLSFCSSKIHRYQWSLYRSWCLCLGSWSPVVLEVPVRGGAACPALYQKLSLLWISAMGIENTEEEKHFTHCTLCYYFLKWVLKSIF